MVRLVRGGLEVGRIKLSYTLLSVEHVNGNGGGTRSRGVVDSQPRPSVYQRANAGRTTATATV